MNKFLTDILGGFGMGDGEGNTSSTRVILVIIVLAVVVPRVVNAIATRSAPDWSPMDLAMLGIAAGQKLVQNHQETKAEVAKAEAAKPTVVVTAAPAAQTP